MEPGFNISVKSAEPKKKKRSGALEDNINNQKFATVKMSNSHSWNSETGDTIESKSVNIKEECLVKETSFDYKDNRAFTRKNLKHTPKSSKKTITKRVLEKLLRKISFLNNNNNDILLDKPVVFLPLLKNLVNVSVRKSFTLDISLNNIVRKSAQKKLVVVRKLFSKINSFEKASIPSKFAGIIRTMFTSKSSLAQASKKTEEMKILVNTNLKKSSGHSDWTVVVKKILVRILAKTVHTVLSEFGIIRSIKMQLVGLSNMNKETWDIKDIYRALLYTLPMGTNVHNIWNYVNLVDGKTSRCAVVCFESAEFLDAVMDTTLVLKGVNLRWFHLGFSKCAEYEKISHMSLSCSVGGNFSFRKSPHKLLSDVNKSRLATIYAKHLAPVAHSIAFGEVFWAKIAGINSGFSLEMKSIFPVISDVEKKFAVLESSFASLVGQIGELAKRLDLFVPAVFQPSPGCQLLVTLLSQNQVGGVVMEEDLGKATSNETVVILDFSASPEVKRLENMLEGLSTSVLSLTVRFDGSILAGGAFPKPLSQ
ncbi:hypothetical protein G9A89_016385 [Geosiphon pyriformis]|nr:hypothetical protein G9A89_016385 [Geosiphon pyriformis]